MKLWVRTAVAAASLLFATQAQAAIVDYSSFHVLGDSLSDTGNAYAVTRGRVPESPPYWRGRFSNGPVWADRVARRFEARGRPTGNHAFGGAKARGQGRFEALAFPAQATRFRRTDPDQRGDRPLVAIWIGSNDILFADGDRSIRRVGRLAADRVGDVMTGLAVSGVRDFLVFNLPNLALLPNFNGRPADARRATRGARAFNRELGREIDDLEDFGVEIGRVNTWRLLNRIVADPRRFGLRNTERPCLDEEGNRCSRRQARVRAFFDELHPNDRVHAAVASLALREIGGASPQGAAALGASRPPAPVPLPPAAALLLGGLAALGAIARRRRR